MNQNKCTKCPWVKIVFLNRYLYPDHSATGQLLTDLAFELAVGGRAIHVITSRQRYDDPREVLPAREFIRGVQVHRVWALRFGRGRLIGRTFDHLTFYKGRPASHLGNRRRGGTVTQGEASELNTGPVSGSTTGSMAI